LRLKENLIMKIFSNKFVKFFLDKEKSLISYKWSSKTEKLTDEEYKTIILKGVDFVIQYKPKFLIADQRDKDYIVTPELQIWNGKETLPKLFENGIIKFAIIESEDFIIKLATKQTMDEHKEKEYDVEFFDNENNAKEWFFHN
jgi:hypothetical protein